MSDPKIAELIAMSGRATQGEWIVEEADGYITGHIISAEHSYAGNSASRTDSITDSNSMTNKDADFIAALVNWFRETYTKERA